MARRFSRGNNTVMATGTGAEHFIMIHGAIGHRRPARREAVVATVAHVGAVDVIARFATGIDAVVAGNTLSRRESRVVDRGYLGPRCRDMAIITFQCRLNM
jgi:hypothetical protein